MPRSIQFILALLLVTVLAGCAGQGQGASAPKAVEDYLQALVAQDSERLATLSCADWEESALLELDSFQGVTARVEQPACTQSGSDGDAALVTCQGKIVATYGNEDQELPLNARTYRVVQEGGEWRVCGYK